MQGFINRISNANKTTVNEPKSAIRLAIFLKIPFRGPIGINGKMNAERKEKMVK